MYVKSVSVTNLLSYNQQTALEFSKNLNILIGPNGGGKTNILRIMWTMIHRKLMFYWNFDANHQQPRRLQKASFSPGAALDFAANRFDPSKPARVDIVIRTDIAEADNLRALTTLASKINSSYSGYNVPESLLYIANDKLDSIEAGVEVTFTAIDNETPTFSSDNHDVGRILLEYFRNIGVLQIYRQEQGLMRLPTPIIFYSANRGTNTAGSTNVFNLEPNHIFDNMHNAVEHAELSADFSSAAMVYFGFLRKTALLEASRERGMIEEEVFGNYEDVQLLRRQISALGYTWDMKPASPTSAEFGMVFMKSGHLLSSAHMSSGEQAMLSFLVSVVTVNVR